jgi:ABC-2 type transport system ATP-binding protein
MPTETIVEELLFHRLLSGRENLHIVAAARGGVSFGRIDGALEQVGLTARAHDRVKTYSLRMRQRLGIARCVLADPELLILDELGGRVARSGGRYSDSAAGA